MEGKNVLPHVKQAVAAYGGAAGDWQHQPPELRLPLCSARACHMPPFHHLTPSVAAWRRRCAFAAVEIKCWLRSWITSNEPLSLTFRWRVLTHSIVARLKLRCACRILEPSNAKLVITWYLSVFVSLF